VTAAVAALLIGAYLFGSVPFGVLVGRVFFGVDPRTVGSGNIGTANSMRAFGRTGAVLVLIGDAAKGAIPTFVAAHWFGTPWIVAAVGLAAIVGHNWSIFLRFNGGKGVATSLGVLSVLSLPAAMMFGAVWLAAAAILCNAAVPIVLIALQSPLPYVLYAIVALALVIWRHEPNIRRLLAGTELKIGIKDQS
jgi:acyl phosphate:glycerol-3-phosphate acyltransferase